jgi:ribosomal protein S18 acetylase RimI-like enzyme
MARLGALRLALRAERYVRHLMVSKAEELEIRRADIEHDADLIRSLDTSFKTDTVFSVKADGRGFQLVEEAVEPPVVKSFPLDDLDPAREWERTWIAVEGKRAVGVVATQHDRWNQRVIVWHFYVDPTRRGRGIGRRLLDVALDEAQRAGARTAWVETSNLNVPGVRAYERLGFHLCGLDTTLYVGTPAEGEAALFLCRALADSHTG